MNMETRVPRLFFSYSHVDEGLRDQLETQLFMLKRQGVIETWHDRRIGAGQEIDHEIDEKIETSEIILLLVSPDFIASNYCYDREMGRAMALHEARKAVVIPVILRPCDWQEAPFGKLMATPLDGKPVTQWPDHDQAMLEVARAVRNAATRFNNTPEEKITPTPTTTQISARQCGPRSSNLSLPKIFTEKDKDEFKIDAFEYMAKFFENSLNELSQRSTGIEGKFRRIDANRFTSAIYREGKSASRCTIFMGGRIFGNSICYSSSETSETNPYNESLSVEADGQSLYLRSMGMTMLRHGHHDNQRLTFEGAAELYWAMLIQPLQNR